MNIENCLMCKTNTKVPNFKKNNWIYDKDVCVDCNQYILNNSPYYQAQYLEGHSRLSEKLNGTMMVNNFENFKRIFFFSKNHQKIEIPIESMAKCLILNENHEVIEDYQKFNSMKKIPLFLKILFLDDSKIESPIFLIKNFKNALKSIDKLVLDFENNKYQNLSLVEAIKAVKQSKKEFESKIFFENEREIISSKIDDPVYILKKRLALGEITKEEYQNLLNIIRV